MEAIASDYDADDLCQRIRQRMALRPHRASYLTVHRSKTRAKNSRVVGIFILTSQEQTLVRGPGVTMLGRRVLLPLAQEWPPCRTALRRPLRAQPHFGCH